MKTDNELIAEFMKYPYQPVKAGFEKGSSYVTINKLFDSRDECFEYCDKINKNKNPEECFFPLPESKGFGDFILKYDTSWDWLMPVVEKIDLITPEIKMLDDLEAADKYFEVTSLPIASKIEEVYKAVVEFIKWYNENKKSE